MPRILFSLFQLMIFTSGLHAQRHNITIFYTPQLTKTDFLQESHIVDFVDTWLKNAPASKPFLGKYFGAMYTFQTTRKTAVSLMYKYNVRGQRSEIFYNYKGKDPSDNPVYGGNLYQFIYWSSSLSLGYSYAIFIKPKFRSSISGTWGIDILDKYIIYNNGILKPVGDYENGCCRTGVYKYSRSYFNNLARRLNQNFYRFEYSASLKNEIVLFPHVNLILQPEVTYASKLSKRADQNVDFRGHIFSAGLLSGLTFQF